MFVVVQSLSHIQLFETPWTAACQGSLSVTVSWSLFKLMSIISVMSFNHLILCLLFLFLFSTFPSIRVFFLMIWIFASGGQSIGASALASVLSMNIQGWFPLGWTGLISLQSKGLFQSLLQHHSSKASILWCSTFLMVQLSYIYKWTTTQPFQKKVKSYLLWDHGQTLRTLC